MNTGAVRLFVPSVYDGDAGCHLFTAAGKRANDDILSTFYNFSLASKLQLLVPLQLFVFFFFTQIWINPLYKKQTLCSSCSRFLLLITWHGAEVHQRQVFNWFIFFNKYRRTASQTFSTAPPSVRSTAVTLWTSLTNTTIPLKKILKLKIIHSSVSRSTEPPGGGVPHFENHCWEESVITLWA